MNAATSLRGLRGLLTTGSLAFCAALLSCDTLDRPEAQATRSIAPRIVFNGSRPYTVRVRVRVSDYANTSRQFFYDEVDATSGRLSIPGMPTGVRLLIEVWGLIEDGSIVWSAQSDLPPGTEDKHADVAAQANALLQPPSISITEIAGIRQLSFTHANGRGEIYYVLDESTPLTRSNGMKYQGTPVPISGDGQIKARVYDFSTNPPGASDILIQNYSFPGNSGFTDNLQVSPSGGYTAAAGYTVTLSHSQTQYIVRYTTDGTDPRTSSTARTFTAGSESIPILAQTRLRAVVVNSSGQDVSASLDVLYHVSTTQPSTTVYPPLFGAIYGTNGPISVTEQDYWPTSLPLQIQLQANYTGSGPVRVLYTTNFMEPGNLPGSPDTATKEYTLPIPVGGATTIKARTCTYDGSCSSTQTLNIRETAVMRTLPTPAFDRGNNVVAESFPIWVTPSWKIGDVTPMSGEFVFRYNWGAPVTETSPAVVDRIEVGAPGTLHVKAFPANGSAWLAGPETTLTIPGRPAGAAWIADANPPSTGSGPARINGLAIWSDVLYAATSRGVWRRLPTGTSWEPFLATSTPDILAITVFNDFVVYGHQGGLRYTHTGNVTTGFWIDPTTESGLEAPVRAFGVHPGSGTLIAAADDGIWTPYPGQMQEWEMLAPLPVGEAPIAMSFIGDDVFIATITGVYRWNLRWGGDWTQVGGSLPYPLHDMIGDGANLYVVAGGGSTQLFKLPVLSGATSWEFFHGWNESASEITISASLDVQIGNLYLARTTKIGTTLTSRVHYFSGMTAPPVQLAASLPDGHEVGDMYVTPRTAWVGTGMGIFRQDLPLLP